MTMSPLRVVCCSAHPAGFGLVSAWARENGHELVLLVTLPGAGHYGDAVPSVLDEAGELDVLSTKRLRAVAAPLVAALEPDLVVSAAFPRRIPAEITRVPRYGAVNLHPAPLPRGRGPCPQRLTYEGDETVGATLHRTGEDFDTGAVLSVKERPLRDDELTPTGLMAAWAELLAAVLDEGARRAVAGEAGEPQDESLASYAGRFTDEERCLDWSAPTRTLRARVAALNMMSPTARARIDGREVIVRSVQPAAASAPGPVGSVVGREGDAVLVRVGDGVVAVVADEPV